jgi:hypothetical protein
MHTTEPITPTAASEPLTLGDAAVEIVPLISTVLVAGPPVVLMWVGTVLFALLLAGPFALIMTLVVVLAAAVALAMLAGAILATPYLLVRHVGRRLTERRRISRTARATFVTMATEGSS